MDIYKLIEMAQNIEDLSEGKIKFILDDTIIMPPKRCSKINPTETPFNCFRKGVGVGMTIQKKKKPVEKKPVEEKGRTIISQTGKQTGTAKASATFKNTPAKKHPVIKSKVVKPETETAKFNKIFTPNDTENFLGRITKGYSLIADLEKEANQRKKYKSMRKKQMSETKDIKKLKKIHLFYEDKLASIRRPPVYKKREALEYLHQQEALKDF